MHNILHYKREYNYLKLRAVKWKIKGIRKNVMQKFNRLTFKIKKKTQKLTDEHTNTPTHCKIS